MPYRDPKAVARDQDKFLSLLRQGKSEAEAVEAIKVKPTLIDGWEKKDLYGFRARYREAQRGYKKFLAGEMPDFLGFREQHFAYFDLRSRTVKRARNSWYQIDATQKLEANKRLIMTLPPGHIKTTLFSIERSVYDIFKDRNVRILAVQKNRDEAAKLIAAVQERLGDHSYYHYLAEQLEEQGDVPITCPLCLYAADKPFQSDKKGQPGDKWGAFGFRVLGRTGGEKDDTMQAMGVGSQIQGVRADRIVLDDIQDPMAPTKSMKDSDDLTEWTNKVILGRITDQQQLVVLANFFAPDDYAHRLIDDHQNWPVVNYPAILNHEEKKILCPEFWTFDALMQKKEEVGDQVWHYTWMQEEGSYDSAVFRREALEAAKDEDYLLGQVPSQVTHVFLGCDPAISQFCAICVWGLDTRTGQRFLVDIFNEKGLRTFQNIQASILDLTRRYAPRVAAIEMNNVQGSISNDPDFVRAMRNLGTRVTTYQTRTEMGARAETDSYDISSIGGLFDAGLITLPYGGTQGQRDRVDAYINQLLAWRPGVKYITRDMLMATLFAESEAFPVAQKGAREKKPYKPKAPKFALDSDGVSFAWSRSADLLIPGGR